MHHLEGDFQNETIDAVEIKEPRMYKVLLLNDDYSSMEFVIKVLMQIFHR